MAVAKETLRLSREECVEMALGNNRVHKISQYDIQIAEAMLKQAKSAYWPTLSASGMVGIMDEPLVFTTPASSITTPLGPIPIEENKIDMMDEEVLVASLNLKYPLYAGGRIKAINEQARFGVEAARQGVRRSELEVVRDVDRAYYGTVMARKLVGIADDTLQRMEVTLDLTKRLYEEGSGAVKKTDYLRNKTMVEVVRSAKSKAKAMETRAATALVNLMGLDHGTVVEPA
ncbi:MAG: TolC family protein, partial [Verrucomicrobiota bacterium]